MRHLLIHPAHRKLIRLMRNRLKDGHPIVFIQSDFDAFHAISQGTMTMIDRHQKIYRLILTAIYRPIKEIDSTEKVCIVGNAIVNVIEKCFAQAERKHLGTTILSGYLVPTLQWIVNKRRKHK